MSEDFRDASFSFSRLLLVTLLAIWLGVTLGVWWTATSAFRVVSVRENPSLAKTFAALPEAGREKALRHIAGEMNRRLFRAWNGVQLVLGVLVLLLAARADAGLPPGRRSGGVLLGGILLAVVAAHAFWFAPRIEELGRALDFADRAKEADRVRRFGMFHGAYVATDLAKAGVLLLAWWRGVRRRGGGG